MKNIKSIGLVVTAIIFIFGCSKLKDPAGQRGVAAVPFITNVQPGIFDSKDLVNSYVQFVVSLPAGVSAESGVIVASYNNDLERTQIATLTSFPATVKIVSGDVIQKLGINASTVVNGDVFMIEVLTTSDGVTTRSNAILNVSVACAFNPAISKGSYHAVSADWQVAGNITLTADVNDQYTIFVSGLETIDGNTEDKGPLVMHIDPSTFAVTAPNKILVSNVSWGPYHNLAYSGDGVYSSCDGSYTMSFDITVDEGDFGIFSFTFTKNP